MCIILTETGSLGSIEFAESLLGARSRNKEYGEKLIEELKIK